MSTWRRITNLLRGNGLNHEIDEELESHIAEAIAEGRDPEEARRAFGSSLRHREASRDVRISAWLDSLRADAIFGLRQLRKNKVTSGAAILSLALALGACTAAFRLVDALLLRPLPVSHPGRIHVLVRQGVSPDGKPFSDDTFQYPLFLRLQSAAKDQAALVAISPAQKIDVNYGSGIDTEKVSVQYVSGSMFDFFALRPEIGRVLQPSDDSAVGATPYAVLSFDHWSNRFGRDPAVIGRTFRTGDKLFEIVGVAAPSFTGTDPGTITDVFLPAVMHPDASRDDANWTRTYVLVERGTPLEPLREKLEQVSQGFEAVRAQQFKDIPKEIIDTFLKQTVVIARAETGVSELQAENRRPLQALAALAFLVLLIACANVANLLAAQAAAREREMAMRISLGAGAGRLMQLSLVHSAILGGAASILGLFLGWQITPFIVSMVNPPDNPARLSLPFDARFAAFSIVLTVAVICLFGLLPAFRASTIHPAVALRGSGSPRSRRRLMNGLVALQVAFCFLVLFVAGMFVATFERLSHAPLGFVSKGLLTVETYAQQGQTPMEWERAADQLRRIPGVESVAYAGWPLLDGNSVDNFVALPGGRTIDTDAYFIKVSSSWLQEMKIPLVRGRYFLPNDTGPGSAVITETFAKVFFHDEDPVGRSFEIPTDGGARNPYRVVGVVQDIRFRNLREPKLPVAFLPFAAKGGDNNWVREQWATFLVRNPNDNAAALSQAIRRELPAALPEFRITRIRTQDAINSANTVRERLLALLGAFFAATALLLAAVGLYGVMHYAVLQRRKEIGIRMAVGAGFGAVVGLVTKEVAVMLALGASAGLTAGLTVLWPLQALFFEVSATNLSTMAFPALTLFMAAVLAALPPVIRAVRIVPASMLRAE